MPASLRGARVSVSWAALVGIALLILAAAVVFTIRVGAARAEARPRPVASGTTGPSGSSGQVAAAELTRTSTPAAFATAPPGPSPTGTASAVGSAAVDSGAVGSGGAAATGGRAAGAVVVDVAGHVVRPGIVRAPTGARVVDALALAGGARAGADLARINLARVLVDGEQIYVPTPGETAPQLLGGAGVAAGSSGSAVGGAGSPPGGAGSAVVDLNQADLSALDALPGVGPVLAQRILDWRAQHGRFSSVDELGEVSGIGDKVLGNLRPLVTV